MHTSSYLHAPVIMLQACIISNPWRQAHRLYVALVDVLRLVIRIEEGFEIVGGETVGVFGPGKTAWQKQGTSLRHLASSCSSAYCFRYLATLH